jgi:hypothetical protein
VTAIAPNDAWAVGSTGQVASSTGLIEHWNGRSWKRVAAPVLPGSGLSGVSGTGPKNVWAVGTFFRGDGQNARTVALRWTGGKWVRATSANPGGSGATSLFGVTAVPGGGAWAAGASHLKRRQGRTLVEHLAGGQWVQIPSPRPGPSPDDELRAISAASPSSVFAVGFVELKGALAEHWNGHQWTTQLTPAIAGAKAVALAGVSADSATDAWAVGDVQTKSDNLLTLIEHWNGASWQQVASPTP